MIQTVTFIEEGLTSSGRFPYALTMLSCGHKVSVRLRDTAGTCCGCGKTLAHPQGESFKPCVCGAWSAKDIDSPKPNNPADRLTKVGDVVECDACDKNVEKIAWLRSLPKYSVSHARFDPRFSPGSYHLYRRDTSSPSGFFLLGSVPATKEFDAVLREIAVSPLSPTER